ncbi:hypothetical protein [Brevibacillus sp. HB2.2]|uniref:hypothetical protein n=1 Tax=Brevibacillus sp. HB2.2 TaxID=2738846 RepID=UPI00156ACBD0|nr:hypothetical protein [Brevibacillus sp. HB2.2]NRS46434.1 hypothetical protein [Brevibacillus sp. HB2.2]
MKETDQYHVWDRYKQVISCDYIAEKLLIDDDGVFLSGTPYHVSSIQQWRHWVPSTEEYFFRRIWGPHLPVGTQKVIPINNISLSKRKNIPLYKDSVELFGQLDQPVLLKSNHNLVGNQKHYQVAMEAGLKLVPVAFN